MRTGARARHTTRLRVHFAKSMYEEEAIANSVRNSDAAIEAASKPVVEKAIANSVRISIAASKTKEEQDAAGVARNLKVASKATLKAASKADWSVASKD